MTDMTVYAMTFAAALGCGMSAGVFFAFSSFVMKGLYRLPAPQAIAAMQSINIVAVTPAFMTVLFGTAAVCAVMAAVAVMNWRPESVYLLAGAALYWIGTILLTMVYHVPRNNALGRIAPEAAESHTAWERYYAGWMAWNHVRGAAALAASAAFVMALGAA